MQTEQTYVQEENRLKQQNCRKSTYLNKEID